MSLSQERCRKIEKTDKPLGGTEAAELAKGLEGWNVGDKSIERGFKFRDFAQSMKFVNRVAGIADEEDHHPDIVISYDNVRVAFSTHKIGGLSRNDFIMAAKVDALLKQPA